MVLTQYKQRRQRLYANIAQQQGDGVIVLISGFECDDVAARFRQEPNFYYLTGIQEPALIFCYFDGQEILYIPDYPGLRKNWVSGGINISDDPRCYGVNEIRFMGAPEKGYSFDCRLDLQKFDHVIKDIVAASDKTGKVFSLFDNHRLADSWYNLLWTSFKSWYPQLADRTIDCSSLLYDLRRTKDAYEIDCIQKAVDITCKAQQKVATALKQGMYEYEVQALLEYVFMSSGAIGSAFPSIVASGKNSTILHYNDNNQSLKNGDLVVVDIGSSYALYTSDITRTFPVGGQYSARQQEVYECVRETQAHVAAHAKPGMYIKNPQAVDQSLHHIAVDFLKKTGFDRYFVHGIGHYMGLNVHDVGDYTTPLRPGDVFTIEPGIYIPEERCGVRIEDDYLITEDGVYCFSESLPRVSSDVCALMNEQAHE